MYIEDYVSFLSNLHVTKTGSLFLKILKFRHVEYFLMNASGCGFLVIYVCLSPWHKYACMGSFFLLANSFISLYFGHDK